MNLQNLSHKQKVGGPELAGLDELQMRPGAYPTLSEDVRDRSLNMCLNRKGR